MDDIPDSALDEIADMGALWIYFLSVWQTGEAGRKISINHPGWKEGFKVDIPDLTDEDICGSGFAISEYGLHKAFGEQSALLRLKNRINERGMKLMLDLVPNHTAIDHVWVASNPEYFVHGTDESIQMTPQNFLRVGDRILAHGRDPYFDGWPDTLQLNYGNPTFREAMFSEISKTAETCDGLRCDMAMLVLPDVFSRTWGIEIEHFWSTAIATVREKHPKFTFMAEVYWDREWDLQQVGFDFTYDKRLYDRLRQNDAQTVREHFWATNDYQQGSARFLENHDEPRAAGTFNTAQHKAAAILTFFSQGLRFFHQGQFEGYKKRVSVHIQRRPKEIVDEDLQSFYKSLLSCLKLPVVHSGEWRLLNCSQAWDGNWTLNSIIAFAWQSNEEKPVYVVVNYADHQSQCYVNTPHGIGLSEFNIKLSSSDSVKFLELSETGFFTDLPPWGFAVFA